MFCQEHVAPAEVGAVDEKRRTRFFTHLARVAKSSVLCVSAADACAGLMLAIITVLALPPSEPCMTAFAPSAQAGHRNRPTAQVRMLIACLPCRHAPSGQMIATETL